MQDCLPNKTLCETTYKRDKHVRRCVSCNMGCVHLRKHNSNKMLFKTILTDMISVISLHLLVNIDAWCSNQPEMRLHN